MGRSKKKSYSKRHRQEAVVKEDEDTASTEDTESELTEETPLVEKNARNQRKAERKHKSPTTLWSDLNLMCSGCCGAMEVMESAEEDEDLFADEENLISKFGHSIMHKAGFAPPVKIIKCTPLDDDTVITTPKVLIELAKQYDKERFWVSGTECPNDETDGTVATSRTTLSSMTSRSRRLIPSISFSTGRSRASKSVRSMGGKAKKSKDVIERIKKPQKVSEGRFEI